MSMLFRFPGVVASAKSVGVAVPRSLSASFDALGTTGFEAFAVDTNAGTARWTRANDLTGNADAMAGSFSVWINPTAVAGTQQIYTTGTNEIRIGLSGDRFNVFAENAAGTTILDYRSPIASVAAGLQHWCGSWDLSTAGRRWLRKNGVTQVISQTTFTVGEIINYTFTNHCIGANPAGGSPFSGRLAEFWFESGLWIPESDANVLKFISSVAGSGVPINLGADGTTPGFGQPIMYFSRRSGDAVSVFAQNRGTDAFTFIVTGTPLDGGSIGGV